MKVYVDTNVLIDFVCRREPFAEQAKKLFANAYLGKCFLQISALSLVTTMYVAHKYGYDEVRENLKRVVSFVTVLDLESQTVIDMLSSEWKDYEDATQKHTALLADADCIVTRNKKNFLESTLPVYTVSEFLEKI